MARTRSNSPFATLSRANEAQRSPLGGRLLSAAGAVIFTFLMLMSEPVHALPPAVHWEQLETAHFVIVYDAKQAKLAHSYAQYAEQAFASVAPVFGLWPQKTVVVIDDSTDLANGSATGIPYPLIEAYPVLPMALDSIGDYGNWGLELITHEYTHILNFEPATGFMKPLRYIFGSVIRPNALLPRWYSEGLAVEMETRLSHFGRLRSANYLAIIRAMAEDGALRREDIARINEVSIPDFPGGARPYLMGALLWDEMVRTKGQEIVGDLNTAYSRRMPFFINEPVKIRLGLDYAGVLAAEYDRAEKIVARQLATIHQVPAVSEVELQQPGFFSRSPRISPDGQKLAFIAREHDVDSEIFLLDRTGPNGPFLPPESVIENTKDAAKEALKADGNNLTTLSWMPDSKSIVHDGVEDHHHYYTYSDLFRLDIAENKDQKLTHGLRAREPVVAPDGRSIVFVQITPGSTQLSSVLSDGSQPIALYTPADGVRVSHPEFLSAHEIIFSEKGHDGLETLNVLKVRMGSDGSLSAIDQPHAVLTTYRPAHDARITKRGLLFVSEKTGVANLYLAPHDLHKAHAVTNTTTQILMGELDPINEDVYYSRLQSYGPQLFRAPHEAWIRAKAEPAQIGAFVDVEWPRWTEPDVKVDVQSEDYSPWKYLIPRYWIPGANVTSYASYFSASTEAADPTGRHVYTLSASYDTLTNNISTFGAYTNKTTSVPITLSAYNLYDYVFSGGFTRQTSDVSLMTDFFLTERNRWHGGLGWDYNDATALGYSLRRNGPVAQVSYSNAKRKGLQISPESGQAAVLTFSRYLPSISDLEYETTTFSFAKYFSKWILPEHHVFALFASGSVAPRLNNYLFGTSTIGGNYEILPGVRGFVMRGYYSGAFIGKNLLLGSAEYRFPISYTYHGYKTAPFFAQRWHGDCFVDALTLDGLAYDFSNQVYYRNAIGNYYYGTGAEMKLDATVFYHLPIQFILGLYYGFDARSNPTHFLPYIGLGVL